MPGSTWFPRMWPWSRVAGATGWQQGSLPGSKFTLNRLLHKAESP
jgi:hypothetical protein